MSAENSHKSRKPAAAAIQNAPPEASSALPIRTQPGGQGAAPNWRVYCLHRLADRKPYVGVTRRPLAVRLSAHDRMARLRPKLGGPGTLAAAIRGAYDAGGSFAEDFAATVLAEASSPVDARNLERHWIDRLGAAAPGGFNIMPGGASLGGPANSVSVMLDHPRRGRLAFQSLMEAVTDLDRERRARGQAPIRLGTVYARRAMGWSVEEALELRAHTDERRRRARFWWHGRSFETIGELARSEGLPIATIRSRLHRARRAGCGASHDAAWDRRRPGARRTDGISFGRQRPLWLPHPTDPTAGPVTAADFSRATGLPRATLQHRYHRLMDRSDPTTLPRTTVLAALIQAEERRVMITLPVPDGPTLCGAVRAVVRHVLGDPALCLARLECLGSSAIRARLRQIPGWPGSLAPEAVQWAFGFRPDARPTNPVRAAA